MKKLLLVPILSALVISSGPVLAQDGWYMGMDLGAAVARPGNGREDRGDG